MKLQASPKVFMGLAALALVGGGGGAYYQWNSLQDVQAQAEALRQQMKDPAEVNRQLEQSGVQLAEFGSRLSHLEKGVPQMAYMATMLSELDRIGTESGINVLGVRPIAQASPLTAQQSAGGDTPTAARKPYQELNIEVKGRGDYRSVLTFVQALQRFPKIVAARTISITPKVDTEKGTQLLDITVEIRAYMFPTPQAGGKVAAAGSEVKSNG